MTITERRRERERIEKEIDAAIAVVLFDAVAFVECGEAEELLALTRSVEAYKAAIARKELF